MTTIRTIERKPRQAPPAGEQAPLLLLLHGYGSHERDLFDLSADVDPRFHVVSARAPLALSWGGFAWYHLGGSYGRLVPDAATRAQGIDALEKFVVALPERVGTDPRRTYLLGFSQGAIISLALLLRRPALVAGVAALSGYLDPETVPEQFDPAALAGRPVLMEHGVSDQVIPVEGARWGRDYLKATPVALEYHEYPTGHGVHPEGLRLLHTWLAARLEETP